MATKRTPITAKHIKRVAVEIAEHARISPEEAMRVLEALNIDKLPEQAAALANAISDPVTAQALGYSESQVKEIRQTLASGVSLNNLRVGLKAPGAAVTLIV